MTEDQRHLSWVWIAPGLFWYLQVLSFYQYLHWQLFHIITNHLTSDIRISDAGRKVLVPHYPFSEITHCSQMCPSPWSICNKLPTRIGSSFCLEAFALTLEWDISFYFCNAAFIFPNYPIPEVFLTGTFVNLRNIENNCWVWIHITFFISLTSAIFKTSDFPLVVLRSVWLAVTQCGLHSVWLASQAGDYLFCLSGTSLFYCRCNSNRQKL